MPYDEITKGAIRDHLSRMSDHDLIQLGTSQNLAIENSDRAIAAIANELATRLHKVTQTETDQ